MLGPHRRSIEREQSTTLENPIEDRLGQVFVVQHTAPTGERFVCGEDHGAFVPVSVVDDVKQHVGGIGAVRQIADFIDDEHARAEIDRQRVGESTAAKRRGQIINEFGSGHEERIRAILNRPVGNRDRQVRLPASRFPSEDQAAALVDKLRCEDRSKEREAHGGLVEEVEIINGLEKGKVRASDEAIESRLLSLSDFLGDDQGEEVAVGPFLLFGASCQGDEPANKEPP